MLQGCPPNQYNQGRIMIILESLNSAADLKKGDLLLISDGTQVIAAKVKELNVLPNNGGTEVIYNKKKNRFFNIMLYLQKRSWVKQVRIVRSCK